MWDDDDDDDDVMGVYIESLYTYGWAYHFTWII